MRWRGHFIIRLISLLEQKVALLAHLPGKPFLEKLLSGNVKLTPHMSIQSHRWP
jgi:hypothetical protein